MGSLELGGGVERQGVEHELVCCDFGRVFVLAPKFNLTVSCRKIFCNEGFLACGDFDAIVVGTSWAHGCFVQKQ